MKKEYVAPSAEKLTFDYTESVVASGGSPIAPVAPIKPGPPEPPQVVEHETKENHPVTPGGPPVAPPDHHNKP